MKKKKITLITSIIGLILAVGGLTYAYIRKTASLEDNEEFNTLTCLEFSLEDAKDENENVINGAISVTNAFPIEDEEGLKTTPHTFTVTNKCQTPIKVEINLETFTVTNQLSKAYLKFNLDNEVDNYTAILNDKQTKTAYYGASSNAIDKVYLTGTGTSGDSKTYNLRLWIDEATTFEQGGNKNYKGKIVAVASPVTGIYTPDFEATSGTLLYALKNGNYLYTNALTNPGSEVSTLSEAVIGETEDDYGTSYYFRGNPDNNYVVFNNMCWRIVRINGNDGTAGEYNNAIKLILQNERGTDCNVPSYSYNYARYDGTNITSAFNGTAGVYDTATGSGFMYGNPSATSYLEAQANTTDSTILTRLKSWYDRVFTTEAQNMLADTIWCGDKSLNSGVGYGSTYSNYGAYKRLITNKKPSLICPSIEGAEKLSKYTAEDTTNGNGLLKTEDNGTTKYYKIGLLTADEAAFAGGVYGVKNNTYYLYNGHYYWLLSPCNFGTTHVRALVWFVSSTGYLSHDVVAYGFGVRPTIALISSATLDTSIQNQDGTINNPYIIG